LNSTSQFASVVLLPLTSLSATTSLLFLTSILIDSGLLFFALFPSTHFLLAFKLIVVPGTAYVFTTLNPSVIFPDVVVV